MLTRTFYIFVILTIAIAAAAKEPETLEQLQSRAASAENNKKPELYVELSRRQVEAANDAYNNNAEQARTLLEQATKSGETAATTSVETGKHLKKVEIELRKISSRLMNIQRTWAFEDQQAVQVAIEHIDAARSKLLDRMFRK
jgi:hypothetical protein